MAKLDEHCYAVGVVDRWITLLVMWQGSPGIGTLAKFALKWRGTDIPVETLTDGPPIIMHGASAVAVHPTARLGARVVIMHGVTIGRADLWRAERTSDEPGVIVGDDVFLGAGCAILYTEGRPVITIGRGAVIGANSVVTRPVGEGEIWAGSPARRIGSRD